jgi:hypothetical protein
MRLKLATLAATVLMFARVPSWSSIRARPPWAARPTFLGAAHLNVNQLALAFLLGLPSSRGLSSELIAPT